MYFKGTVGDVINLNSLNKDVFTFHLHTFGPDINVQSKWSNSTPLFSSKSLPPSLKDQVNMWLVQPTTIDNDMSKEMTLLKTTKTTV